MTPRNSVDDSGLNGKVVSVCSDKDGKVNLDPFFVSLIDTLGSLYHSLSDTNAGARSRSNLIALIMMRIRRIVYSESYTLVLVSGKLSGAAS